MNPHRVPMSGTGDAEASEAAPRHQQVEREVFVRALHRASVTAIAPEALTGSTAQDGALTPSAHRSTPAHEPKCAPEGKS